MSTISITYEGDLHTVATHKESGQKLHTDAPKDHEGRGENFSPTDLVATALGSCIATVIGIHAKKSNMDLVGMRVDVKKTMSKDAPRKISALRVDVWMPIKLVDKEKEIIIKVADSCPVSYSLHPEIKVDISFHW